MTVYLNGEYLPRERAMVPVDDRGFLFGDGVYEVSRALDGRVVDHDRHWRRLLRSLGGIDLAVPGGMDEEALRDIAERVLAACGLGAGHATVYLQVTRGAATPRTHHYPDPRRTPPTVFVSAAPFTPLDAARAAGVAVITLPDLRWARCDIKSINLLPNVMAKQAAAAAGAHEAIFVRDDVFTEGAATNLFGVVDGTVRTHPASTAVLPGITREIALELARALDLPVREEPLAVDELPGADELFLTSTTNDVMPVVAVDGRSVGDGTPGPLTRQLAAAFAARAARPVVAVG